MFSSWSSMVAVAAMLSCTSAERSFPVPSQRPSFEDPLEDFVEMGRAAAHTHIVRDISSQVEGLGWRWAYERPEMRFRVHRVDNQRFVMDFGIVPAEWQGHLPVTLQVSVNGHPLGEMLCEQVGDRRFEKDVPPAWLRLREYNYVVAALDRVRTSPGDGTKLSYTLFRAGFVSR